MGITKNTYPSLIYPVSDLSAFAICTDMFILSLKNGELIHFAPDSIHDFYNWLITHGVREVPKSVQKEEKHPIESSEGLFERILNL